MSWSPSVEHILSMFTTCSKQGQLYKHWRGFELKLAHKAFTSFPGISAFCLTFAVGFN